MTACPDCTEARTRRWHGIYRSGCIGCQCRAIARSMDAFEASKTGDVEGLRAVVERAVAGSPDEAVKQVLWWWKRDHASDQPKR